MAEEMAKEDHSVNIDPPAPYEGAPPWNKTFCTQCGISRYNNLTDVEAVREGLRGKCNNKECKDAWHDARWEQAVARSIAPRTVLRHVCGACGSTRALLRKGISGGCTYRKCASFDHKLLYSEQEPSVAKRAGVAGRPAPRTAVDGVEAYCAELAALLRKKNAAYGDSYQKVPQLLALLIPDVPIEKLSKILYTVRQLDKLGRYLNSAEGEDPLLDSAGYAVLEALKVLADTPRV